MSGQNFLADLDKILSNPNSLNIEHVLKNIESENIDGINKNLNDKKENNVENTQNLISNSLNGNLNKSFSGKSNKIDEELISNQKEQKKSTEKIVENNDEC